MGINVSIYMNVYITLIILIRCCTTLEVQFFLITVIDDFSGQKDNL